MIREWYNTVDVVSKSKESIELTQADLIHLHRWKEHLKNHCNADGINAPTAKRFRSHIDEIEKWLSHFQEKN